MNAVGWISSSKMKVMKKVIATTSTTVEGKPHKKRAIEEIEYDGVTAKKEIAIPIPRPKVVEDLFKCFSAIDIHDHYRQGILKVEERWATKNWRKRIFATLIGMHLTDAFLAYKYECNEKGNEPMQYTLFCSRIAKTLIFNNQVQTKERVVKEITSTMVCCT